MTFLAPTFLWGLAAASLPLIIHLISLRHTRELPFGTLRFIEKLEHETLRNLKIRQWLLVLLRTLIIIALVLMVSRPVLRGFSPTWVGGDVESRVVIIVDNSASMAVMWDGQTLLNRAREALPVIWNQLEGQTALEIYQTNPFKRIFNGTREQRETALRRVQEIPQSVEADDLWSKVDSALSLSKGTEPNQECFILSDFQTLPPRTFWADMRSNDLVDSLKTQWKLYALAQKQVQDNLAVLRVATVSQVKLPTHLLTLSTTVMNDGNLPGENIPVELFLDQNRVGQVVASFKPGQSKGFQFQVYPGKSGIIQGVLEIPPDDYALDNRQTFELSIPQRIACKIVAPSVEDIFLLRKVLASIDGGTGFLDLDYKIDPAPEHLFLEDQDILIIHSPTNLPPGIVAEIQAFLEQGGGLIWFSSDPPPKEMSPHVETLLRLPRRVALKTAGSQSYYSVELTDRSLLLFSDLDVKKILPELPDVYRYNQVQLTKEQQPLLNLHNGDPFLVEGTTFGGSYYYFVLPLNLEWSDLPLRGLIVPLMHRLLMRLATDDEQVAPVTIGVPKVISIKRQLVNARWELVKPSGKRVLLIPDYNTQVLSIPQTDELGSFQVLADGDLYTAFSTRLNPLERPSIRADQNKIRSILGKDQVRFISPEVDLVTQLQDLRRGKSLWRRFLLLAIGLLFFESLVRYTPKERRKTTRSLAKD